MKLYVARGAARAPCYEFCCKNHALNENFTSFLKRKAFFFVKKNQKTFMNYPGKLASLDAGSTGDLWRTAASKIGWRRSRPMSSSAYVADHGLVLKKAVPFEGRTKSFSFLDSKTGDGAAGWAAIYHH